MKNNNTDCSRKVTNVCDAINSLSVDLILLYLLKRILFLRFSASANRYFISFIGMTDRNRLIVIDITIFSACGRSAYNYLFNVGIYGVEEVCIPCLYIEIFENKNTFESTSSLV